MRRIVTALLLVTTALPIAAQERASAGSGVAPATVGNSAVRPIVFGAGAPASTLVMPLAAMPPVAALNAPFGTAAPAVARALADAKFDGKAGKIVSLRAVGPYRRILFVGTGTAPGGVRDALGRAAQELRDEAGPVSVATPAGVDAQEAALGYALGQYRFDRYKTAGKTAPPTDPVTIISAEPGAEASWRRGSALVEGVTLSRDLATEPANTLYPEEFVRRVRAAFAGVPRVTIEVLDEAAMARLSMGSLIGVGQGSHRPSRLMIVRYDGAPGGGAPLAVVGKGITFDSGGISLKPGLGMWEMKADMSGAASAMGAALSLAKSGASVNFVAAAALAENMPGANAQRPGDVVRTMSGKTIEVLNTDAEGRLVLADAVEYVADRYKPAGIVTIATLTGAVVGALDDEFAGVFIRDEALGARVNDAASTSGEAIWRLPLHPNYADDMKSDIADIKNVVEGGRPGAGFGAHFIGYFVPPAVPWAHLDIAGVFWSGKATPTGPKGATGWGVRLLDALARGR